MRTKFFELIARLSCRRPGTVVLVAVGLAVASLILASRLEMHTGRVDLLSSDNREVKNYNEFTHEFGSGNNVYFILESSSLERAKRCADALAAEISKNPAYIRDVLYKLDLDSIKGRLLLHLTPAQLRAVDEYLNENEEVLIDLVRAKNLSEVFPEIGKLAEKRARQNFKDPATRLELSALIGLLEGINSFLWGRNHSTIEFLPAVDPGSLPLGVSNDPDGYLVGKNGQTVILLARPNAEKEDSIDFLKPMMSSLTEARNGVAEQFPDVSVGMTGLPTFAYGDLRVMEDEMPFLFIAALAAAVIIFFLFFRHPLEIAFASVAMLIAVACTLGATKIFIGHLNIMSSVFAVTMVSLGIDFGVHLIARFKEEQLRAETFEGAMRKALVGAGPPVMTGALTTAAAFFLLAASDFKGLAELGAIAGTGILLCLISMLTVVPSLISLWHAWRHPSLPAKSGTETFLIRLLRSLAETDDRLSGAIIIAAAVGTLAMCYFAPRVSFDYNFLHIQPITSKTAEYEEVLMERTGLAPSFNVIVRDDLKSLDDAAHELAEMPSVSRVDSASDIVPVSQEERIPAAKQVVEKIESIGNHMNRNHDPISLSELVPIYQEMRRGLKRALETKALVEDKEVVSQIERAKRAVDFFLEKSEKARPGGISDKLQSFSRKFFAYVEKQIEILGGKRQLQRMTFADLPENIRTRFVGKTGKYAAYVFPSRSIWDKSFLDRFNDDVRKVAPDAAGTAMFAQALLDTAGRALKECSLLVLGAIVLLVFLDFRKLSPALLSLMSVTVGLIWMLGIMELLGWQYNPINIMAIPVMLGIGIDNGVHIVHRFRDNGYDARGAVLTSGHAILVSSLTTIAGFACLLFSTHRGLTNLAELLVLGMTACLLASLVLLPAVLKALAQAGIKI